MVTLLADMTFSTTFRETHQLLIRVQVHDSTCLGMGSQVIQKNLHQAPLAQRRVKAVSKSQNNTVLCVSGPSAYICNPHFSISVMMLLVGWKCFHGRLALQQKSITGGCLGQQNIGSCTMSMQHVNGGQSGKAGWSPAVLLTAVLDAPLVRTSSQSKRCSANDGLSQQRYGQ